MSANLNINSESIINNFLYKKNFVHIKNDFEGLIQKIDKAFDFPDIDNSLEDINEEDEKNINLKIKFENSYLYYGTNIIIVPEKNNYNNIESTFIKQFIGN
jgi:hypothetical protein